MIEDILFANADKGFAYAVSMFLLWKSYQQDEKYLKVLQQIEDKLNQHVAQKEALIEMIKEQK